MKNREAESNPCLNEQELTYKCFNQHNFDKEACVLQIENYKVCKKFWNSVRADRKRRGVYPALPPVEERERIKQEYLNSVRNS